MSVLGQPAIVWSLTCPGSVSRVLVVCLSLPWAVGRADLSHVFMGLDPKDDALST